jgi:hypothetical protein
MGQWGVLQYVISRVVAIRRMKIDALWSPRCKRDGMKRSLVVLRLALCVVVCLACVTGCKRRPQNYAGLPDPQKGEIIDPHRAE